MAAHGRPTPQLPSPEGARPRYRDRDAAKLSNPLANPYLASHRTFGPPLLPADEAWRWRDRWDEQFGREAPLHVEIGSGNGFFLRDLALAHPDWNVVGVEIRYKRTVLTAHKLVEASVANARIVRYHAGFLDDLFAPGSLSGLYVNHPDPWSKRRHDKHRLIAKWFLRDAARLLRPGGWLRLKTDFLPHVERAVALVAEDDEGHDDPLPFAISGRSDDIEALGTPWPDDHMTNYQRKFRDKGLAVCALELTRTPGDVPGRPV